MVKPMSPNPFKNIFKQNNLSGKKFNSGINNNVLINNNSSLTSQKSATLPVQKIDQVDFREMQTSPFVKKPSEKKPSTSNPPSNSMNMNKSLKNYMDNKLSQSQNNSGISRPSTSNTNPISNPPSDTKRISGRSLSDNLITPVVNKTIKEIYVLNKVGFAGEGVDKTNQDSYFIHENFCNKTNYSYLGVW